MSDHTTPASGDISGAVRAFEEMFKAWGVRLPDAHVAARRAGEVTHAGWRIRFLFDRDERGEFVEFLAAHRMTNDRWMRIYGDGAVESLGASMDILANMPEVFPLEEEFYTKLRERGLSDYVPIRFVPDESLFVPNPPRRRPETDP